MVRRAVQAVCLLIMLILAVCSFPVLAAEGNGFAAAVSAAEGKAGDRVTVTVRYAGEGADIGAFAVYMEYDSMIFEYVKSEAGTAVKNGQYLTKERDSVVSSVYTAKAPGQKTTLSGELFTYSLNVRADAMASASDIIVRVEQVVDGNSRKAADNSEQRLPFTVQPPSTDDARLVGLIPEAGELSPEFHPDIFAYNLEVPFEVKSLTFIAETVQGASCRVNRKNLGAGGSDTDFIFTVTAQDGKTTSKYTVTVHRNEKVTETAEATPKPAAAAGSKSSSSSSGGKTGSSSAAKKAGEESTEGVTVAARGAGTDGGTGTGSHVVFQADRMMPFFFGMLAAAALLAASLLLNHGVMKWKGFEAGKKQEEKKDI